MLEGQLLLEYDSPCQIAGKKPFPLLSCVGYFDKPTQLHEYTGPIGFRILLLAFKAWSLEFMLHHIQLLNP